MTRDLHREVARFAHELGCSQSDIERSCVRKIRYNHKWQARKEAKRVKREKGQRLRTYFCEYCFGWHLTSRVHELDEERR